MRYNEGQNTLETERLLLRPFRLEDADAVAAFCNSEPVYRHTLSLPHPYTADCARSWIGSHAENFRSERGYEYAVTDKADGRLYGCVGLSHHAAHHNGELGYWFGEPHWGRGYATEAARALIDFAFSVKGYHRVYARHFADNPASGRVMQKCGMRFEGIQREHVLKDGAYLDVVCYAIVKQDWKGA